MALSPPKAGAKRRGVTLRAVLIGLVFCLAIAAGEPFGVLVLRSSPMAADYSTGAALFLFFVLTFLVNPFARLVSGSGLWRGELATVYIMMIVGAAIPSWGLTMNLIPLLGGFFYYTTPENDWAALIQPYLPQMLMPDDQEAIQKLALHAPQAPVPGHGPGGFRNGWHLADNRRPDRHVGQQADHHNLILGPLPPRPAGVCFCHLHLIRGDFP